MDKPIIETNDLNYSFHPGALILQGVNLAVPQGSIYGFLGPNGAGKTTTLRLILGLLRQEKTPIKLFGVDLHTNRTDILRKIGSLIEQPSLYGHLTGRENLEVIRLSYQCSKHRIGEVLKIVDLTAAATKKARTYSLGMKQRLAIAIALLNDPDLLILDEPTNGLDPNGIVEIRELMRRLNQQFGKTILISSHLLAEIEKVATHVGIIHEGKLLFQGTLPQLQHRRSAQSIIELEVDDPDQVMALIGERFATKQTDEGSLQIACQKRDQIPEINTLLVNAGVKVYKIGVANNDLEELFMQIISA